MRSIEKRDRIDLGLALMRRRAKPGAVFTTAEIAIYCGCTMQAIQHIERNAIRSVRPKLEEVLR